MPLLLDELPSRCVAPTPATHLAALEDVVRASLDMLLREPR